MKITLDDAIKAVEADYTLVKDEKAKIAHHINKETGESMITYKAAQATRLYKVDTLIKRNVNWEIRRLAWQNILIKRMEADPVYAAEVLRANRCLFSVAGFYYEAMERRLYDSKGYIIQL